MTLLAGSIQLSANSQPDDQPIKISEDIQLIRISEHAYVHVSTMDTPEWGRITANGLIFINAGEAFLFDTPMTDSLTEELYAYMTDVMKLKIAGFIPNHWHIDCMGGLGFLQRQNIESYANQMTIDIARSHGLPVPDHGFRDLLQLQLGDKAIECFYFGAAHSMDNIAIWIPSEQILFPGCMVRSMDSKNLGNTADGDLVAYPRTLDWLLEKFPTAKIVIPGHGRYGGVELIKRTRGYF